MVKKLFSIIGSVLLLPKAFQIMTIYPAFTQALSPTPHSTVTHAYIPLLFILLAHPISHSFHTRNSVKNFSLFGSLIVLNNQGMHLFFNYFKAIGK